MLMDTQFFLKMQKRAARIILDAAILSTSINVFKELKWLNFKSKNSYHKFILVHQRFSTGNHLIT